MSGFTETVITALGSGFDRIRPPRKSRTGFGWHRYCAQPPVAGRDTSVDNEAVRAVSQGDAARIPHAPPRRPWGSGGSRGATEGSPLRVRNYQPPLWCTASHFASAVTLREAWLLVTIGLCSTRTVRGVASSADAATLELTTIAVERASMILVIFISCLLCERYCSYSRIGHGSVLFPSCLILTWKQGDAGPGHA